MKRINYIILFTIFISFVLALVLYPQMPERMASHWNIKGEVDGYMSKFWGLFLIPFLLAGFGLFFFAIPRIDPLKANIEKFRKYYNGFIILFSVFMLLIYIQVILWNAGIKIAPNATLPIGIGLLFFYTGILCEKAKRNWFIGIRTPWTLSNENVWNKTHKAGGKLFKIAGIVALLGAFFQKYALYFILVPIILVTVCTIAYSYFEYQKEIK